MFYYTRIQINYTKPQGCVQEFKHWGGAQDVGAQSQWQKFIPQFLPCHLNANINCCRHLDYYFFCKFETGRWSYLLQNIKISIVHILQ